MSFGLKISVAKFVTLVWYKMLSHSVYFEIKHQNWQYVYKCWI